MLDEKQTKKWWIIHRTLSEKSHLELRRKILKITNAVESSRTFLPSIFCSVLIFSYHLHTRVCRPIECVPKATRFSARNFYESSTTNAQGFWAWNETGIDNREREGRTMVIGDLTVKDESGCSESQDGSNHRCSQWWQLDFSLDKILLQSSRLSSY